MVEGHAIYRRWNPETDKLVKYIIPIRKEGTDYE
jgi:hypothetical protein